jgi:hypothetical protein
MDNIVVALVLSYCARLAEFVTWPRSSEHYMHMPFDCQRRRHVPYLRVPALPSRPVLGSDQGPSVS